MGNGFRQDRGPWPGGGKIPVFAVAIMIVTDLPLGKIGHDHGLADIAPFRS